jgi:hypothetical protein
MPIQNRPSIIAITGPAGSGKSTIARFLFDHYGYARVRFADPLKSMLGSLGLSEYELEGQGKDLPCELLGGHTPRYAMKSLGTEWGRDMMSKTFWSDAWVRRVGHAVGAYIVAEDLRFPDPEEFVVRLMGGIIWRVERPGYGGTDTHPSETEQMHIKYDVLFHNDSTPEYLFEQVRKELED